MKCTWHLQRGWRVTQCDVSVGDSSVDDDVNASSHRNAGRYERRPADRSGRHVGGWCRSVAHERFSLVCECGALVATDKWAKSKELDWPWKEMIAAVLIGVTVGRISDTIRKNSVPQWGIEPWSLAICASIITIRPPRALIAVTFTTFKEKPFPPVFQVQWSHCPPNITVGQISDTIWKNSVPQWGIEPQSLTIWVSVITARPPRTLIAVTLICK